MTDSKQTAPTATSTAQLTLNDLEALDRQINLDATYASFDQLTAQEVPETISFETDPLTAFLRNQDKCLIIGCDEAGRGALFGPVVAAASFLGTIDYDLVDKISQTPAKQRENVAEEGFISSMQATVASIKESFEPHIQYLSQAVPEAVISEYMHELQAQGLNVGPSQAIAHLVNKLGYVDLSNKQICAQLQISVDYRKKDLFSYLQKFQDSKAVTPSRREKLALNFSSEEMAVITAINAVNNETIDSINILQASLLAMKTSVLEVLHKLLTVAIARDLNPYRILERVIILVDGNQTLNISPQDVAAIVPIYPFLPHSDQVFNLKQYAVVKGDKRCKEISVASILAKYYRDALITQLAKDPRYQHYDLANNKGYPTAKHRDAISKHGLTDKHRKSYNVSLG